MTSHEPSSSRHTIDARIVRTHEDIVGTALTVLIAEGWEAVTHAHLAQLAGYSKGTVYKHWPTRTDLLRDAFIRLGNMPHHAPTGDLRFDLVEELKTFRNGLRDQGLDRALAILVDLATSKPEMAQVRDKLVTDGEQILRQLLSSVFTGTNLEAATLMLAGATFDSALLHGTIPSDEFITATVDLVLGNARGGEDSPGVPTPN